MTTPDRRRPARVIAGAAAGVVITAAVSWWTWHQSNRPLAEFPDWLSAWATLFGVGAAIVAGFYAARAFNLESAREQARIDQEAAAQASLVGAWWAEGQVASSRRELAWGMRAPHSVYVTNASQLPVTEVLIVVRHPITDEVVDTLEVGSLGPTADEPRYVPRTPGYTERYAGIREDQPPNLHLRFRDAAGQAWDRGPVGKLQRAHIGTPRLIVNTTPAEERAHDDGV